MSFNDSHYKFSIRLRHNIDYIQYASKSFDVKDYYLNFVKIGLVNVNWDWPPVFQFSDTDINLERIIVGHVIKGTWTPKKLLWLVK